MKYLYSILLGVLVALLVIFPAFRFGYLGARQHETTVTDTIVRIVPSKPIIITKVKTKIIKTSDTVIRFHPFRAIVDTVLYHDTIRTSFEYPSGIFSIDIRRRPDTMFTERVIIYRPEKKKEEWWEKPAMIFGSAVAGYFLGKIN